MYTILPAFVLNNLPCKGQWELITLTFLGNDGGDKNYFLGFLISPLFSELSGMCKQTRLENQSRAPYPHNTNTLCLHSRREELQKPLEMSLCSLLFLHQHWKQSHCHFLKWQWPVCEFTRGRKYLKSIILKEFVIKWRPVLGFKFTWKHSINKADLMKILLLSS